MKKREPRACLGSQQLARARGEAPAAANSLLKKWFPLPGARAIAQRWPGEQGPWGTAVLWREPPRGVFQQAANQRVPAHRRVGRGKCPPAPAVGHRAQRLLHVVQTTVAQQGRSVFEFLLASIESHLRGAPPPSLLPSGTRGPSLYVAFCTSFAAPRSPSVSSSAAT